MRAALAFLFLLAAPLSAELLEAEIRFQGTGCVSCAESLEPRLGRVRGMDTVELDLERSLVRLKLEQGNRARILSLRLRVTQDGNSIVSMRAVIRGVTQESGGDWILTVTGPDEKLRLHAGQGVRLQSGRAYRLEGQIAEAEDGELMLRADSAEAVPQP